MTAKTRLCDLTELSQPGSKGFTIEDGAESWNIFVVRKNGKVYGYWNACPHTGTPLDWLPDQFLDADEELIMCSTHGAEFRIEDGFCVSGPCENQRLLALSVLVEDGVVYVDDEFLRAPEEQL
ncbi:MAG: Rieske (2Fe-2S) protein [Gammaproteobacteria bacterium]